VHLRLFAALCMNMNIFRHAAMVCQQCANAHKSSLIRQSIPCLGFGGA
jgi:hypothetical protein